MEALNVSEGCWSAALADKLLPAFDGDAAQAEKIADMAACGLVEVWEVEQGGVIVGVYVTRWDGPELEILAAVGMADVNLTDAVLPAVEAYARNEGAAAIRLNTFRAGLVQKLVQGMGYRPLHMTLWKAL